MTDKAAIVTSQFSMVDLAGSERNNRTRATGERIKEAGKKLIVRNLFFILIFKYLFKKFFHINYHLNVFLDN